MTARAIRLMAAAAVAVAVAAAMLLGVAADPPSQAEAAGGNPYAVSITRFCRSRVVGRAASASLKLAITLKNVGTEDVAGRPYVVAAAQSPAVDPYHDLTVAHDPVLLHPGDAVSFVAVATNLNLARSTSFHVGVRDAAAGFTTYRVTDFYANAHAIPAC
ncbi:MAG: hypothetical protein QOJ59_1070 [Thermomicrobiales bacterium]|jgi:hypothetical protein|nr:hypothetical protein [Thermomicrobiales bacterium]